MLRGPARRRRTGPPPSTPPRVLWLRLPRQRSQPLAPVTIRRADKRLEKRVRLQRLALELRMELAPQHPRVLGDLADFHVGLVGRLAGDAQSARGEALLVFPIEFVAMAVPLADIERAVGFLRHAAPGQVARPSPQPHGAA